MWSVYVHINKINGKAYVGITSRAPEKRWGYNGIGYKPDAGDNQNRRFWNAIKKYGWDNFSHTIIETELTESEANELEVHYIESFDSYRHGYNSTLGGGGISGYRHSDQVREQMAQKRKGRKHTKEWCDRIRESQICKRSIICLESKIVYDSPSECAKQLGIDDSAILAVCRGALHSTHQLHFQFADEPIKTIEEVEKERKKSSQTRMVKCLETGELYESINECARVTGIDRRNIQRACKSYTSAGGHHYCYVEDDVSIEDISKHNRIHTTRKIRCIETGMIFDSLRECANYFGLKSTGNISSVCNGKQKTFHGYHLEYVSADDRRIKAVRCIEDNRVFDTQKECADYYGLTYSLMNDLCNKRRLEYNGLHFEFVDYNPNDPICGSEGNTKKVKCLETGKIYPSARSCALDLGINPSNVSAVLNRRGRKSAGGFHFEYV